jgi:hypothetical protein
MDTDRNLAFAVGALQAGLIDANQFVEACTLWSSRRNQALADLLIERGWIRPADRLELESAAGNAANKRASDVTAWLPVTPANIRNSEAIVGDGSSPVALAASGNGTPPHRTSPQPSVISSTASMPPAAWAGSGWRATPRSAVMWPSRSCCRRSLPMS